MKQQIIELKKKLLLVELPEGAINVKGFDYKLIGKLTDITEEQYSEWVKECDELTFEGHAFEDYNGTSICDTAKEPFFSKLEAEGIYFENKLGEKPCLDNITAKYSLRIDFLNPLERWQEAQEKVWNKDNTYIFEIL